MGAACPSAVGAVVGALVPDLPATAGALSLLARGPGRFSRARFRADVCAKRRFGGPNAALHSVLPVGAALALYAASGQRGRDPNRGLLGLLLGWAGHALSDALTHADDARPPLWPLSERRWRSPISYWDPAHHARLIALLEHAALLLVVATMLARGKRA